MAVCDDISAKGLFALTFRSLGELAMQTQNRLFDDFARVASSAFNTLGGLREEIELRVRERVERMAAEMDLVPREEFDAVAEMASNARREQELLNTRVAELEAKIEALSAQGVSKPASKKRAAPKSAAASRSQP